MKELAKPMIKNQYGQYLLQVVEEIRATGKANID
jgi:glucose-1-phosphate thymidylyltransferase